MHAVAPDAKAPSRHCFADAHEEETDKPHRSRPEEDAPQYGCPASDRQQQVLSGTSVRALPRPASVSVHLERRDECFLRDLDFAKLTHPLLTLLLFVEELAFT